MARHSSHFLELARKGAEARFSELIDEAKMLVQSFPHLRDAYDPDELPVSFIVAKGSGQLRARTTPKRKKRGMSASARKAVSLRMKKYWAAKRNAKKA